MGSKAYSGTQSRPRNVETSEAPTSEFSAAILGIQGRSGRNREDCTRPSRLRDLSLIVPLRKSFARQASMSATHRSDGIGEDERPLYRNHQILCHALSRSFFSITTTALMKWTYGQFPCDTTGRIAVTHYARQDSNLSPMVPKAVDRYGFSANLRIFEGTRNLEPRYEIARVHCPVTLNFQA